MNVGFVSVYFVNESVNFIFLHLYVQENSLSMNVSFQFHAKICFSVLPMLYEVTTV